jgi:hypothetical protein
MEQSPWEANMASQEVPRVLWNRHNRTQRLTALFRCSLVSSSHPTALFAAFFF